MQLNDLSIPQSWADMMIGEANELDFSLDPHPYFDGELLMHHVTMMLILSILL